ncbi:MAG TPA: RNA methyltransferase, partial [Gemmatimonadales bacterium]|nr:RNA methyltransferase [Gemmatimonadales bacterium]
MSRSLPSLIRDLRLRRGRERRGLALAEGIRLVEEAMAAQVAIRGAAIAPGLEATERGRALKAALAERGVAIESVTDRELAQLADTEHPQGVVAVIEPPRWTLADMAPSQGHPVLVLDAVQDPGNVGAMVRTALALGAAGVVALKGTAELTSPKVLRGSMGALFRLPVVNADAAALNAWLTEQRVALWVAAMDGDPISQVAREKHGAIALVVGNEGAGVGDDVARMAQR